MPELQLQAWSSPGARLTAFNALTLCHVGDAVDSLIRM
jgi:hypothetical protein